MRHDDILASLNLLHPGCSIEPGKLIRVRMEYPEPDLPADVHERIEAASAMLDQADDGLAILAVLNQMSRMEIREATPENRKLNEEWNDTLHRLVGALTSPDGKRYQEVCRILRERPEAGA